MNEEEEVEDETPLLFVRADGGDWIYEKIWKAYVCMYLWEDNFSFSSFNKVGLKLNALIDVLKVENFSMDTGWMWNGPLNRWHDPEEISVFIVAHEQIYNEGNGANFPNNKNRIWNMKKKKIYIYILMLLCFCFCFFFSQSFTLNPIQGLLNFPFKFQN